VFNPVIRTLASGLADLVWPRHCWLCEADADAVLCYRCRAELTADAGSTCPRCSGTVGPYADLADGCPQCRGSRFHFDGAVRLESYAGRLREAVIRLKREPGEPLAEELGGLLATARGDSLSAHQPGVVVPIPLHW
jgi:predicted amidophosphoribosyltransferase